MRVLVLGAGFGGLELTTRLSEEFGDDVDVVLIDQSDRFIFGFSKLDVMFGRAVSSTVLHPYRDLAEPGVRFVQSTVRSIDPATQAGRNRRRHLRRRRSGGRPRSRSAPERHARVGRGR
jgi:sulfide:quinone oxidoreductase